MRTKGVLILLFWIGFFVAEGQEIRGYIINVENGKINVDLTRSQVKVGDTLEVIANGGYMTDPKTKRRVRKADEVLGILKILSTYSEYTIAVPFDKSLMAQLKPKMKVRCIKHNNIKTLIESNKSIEIISSQVQGNNQDVLDIFNLNEPTSLSTSQQNEEIVIDTHSGNNTSVSQTLSNNYEISAAKPKKQIVDYKNLRKKGTRICVISEIPDSVASYPFVKEISKRFVKNGYWDVVNNKVDADMILIVRGYAVNSPYGKELKGYAVVYDKNFKFLMRTGTYSMGVGQEAITDHMKIKSYCSNITDDLKKMNLEPKKTKKPQKGTPQKFEKHYLAGFKAIDNYDYKEGYENLLECVELDPNQWQLYKTIGFCCAELNKFKDALKYFDYYIEHNPLDVEMDYAYGVIEGNQLQKKYVRLMRVAAICGAINTVLVGVNDIIAVSQGKPISGIQGSYANSIDSSSKTASSPRLVQEDCSYCKGTGVSPTPTSVSSFGYGGQTWCEDCHKYVSSSHGYHGQCPSCRGRGYNMRTR